MIGPKSALLHNFAGQSLHGSLILAGIDIVFRAEKKTKQNDYLISLKYILVNDCFSKIYSTMVTTFQEKIIAGQYLQDYNSILNFPPLCKVNGL